MSENLTILEGLLATGSVALRAGEMFAHDPGHRRNVRWDRLEGMMLGLAIGDSLGNTSEGMLPGERRAQHGEVRDYLPNRHAEGKRVGLPSDDTQLAFWTLDQLLLDGGYVPENLARRFTSGRIFGVGSTVRQFIKDHKDSGLPWHVSGPRSAGNGALMRIAPMLFPHIETGTRDLWADTALSAMTTHNDGASIGSCLAFMALLWDLLAMEQPPAPEWWLDRFVAVAHDADPGARYRPRGGRRQDYDGPFPAFVEEVVGDAWRSGVDVVEGSRAWHSGAYLLETVPTVLYILMRHGHDPEEAIVRAVNDAKDNDTVAAIVGAAVGALHGRRTLPERWLDGLIGRTGSGDDGEVFHILDRAQAAFSPRPG